MPGMPRNQTPNLLSELRHPVSGDLRVSPSIVAPEHFRDVLRAFGPQDVGVRRHIIIEIDGWAIQLKYARKHKIPMKFATADPFLARLERATVNLQSLWEKASPFHSGMSITKMMMTPASEASKLAWPDIDLAGALADLLSTIRAVRNLETYMQAFSRQGPSSRKRLERALLWEPLLDLLDKFHIQNFNQHQPLITTVRALHLACGIDPPDPAAVRQTVDSRRKRHR
jgi:hypothetical protein